ncbi:MAG: tetraacyldisaccharide 4'-kinase, partial [Phycisphaerae bacterium]|nr:tetraacyldisaccharide 4'-kinase [Phycisphaerae bacterium]
MDLVARRTITMPNRPYLDIINGLHKGIIASLARALLSALTLPYSLAVHLRNILYDLRILPSYSAEVPVVCVGNIACGGTGKTPMVIALVKMLQELGHRPAILTRGYKGSAEKPADEVLLFAQSLPDVPVVVNPDRVSAAKAAAKQFDIDVLVMDDGFGHRRLSRELDIVLLAEPLEKLRLLPRGLYREPASSLKRADIVIRTHEPLDNPDENYAVRQPTQLVSTGQEIKL